MNYALIWVTSGLAWHSTHAASSSTTCSLCLACNCLHHHHLECLRVCLDHCEHVRLSLLHILHKLLVEILVGHHPTCNFGELGALSKSLQTTGSSTAHTSAWHATSSRSTGLARGNTSGNEFESNVGITASSFECSNALISACTSECHQISDFLLIDWRSLRSWVGLNWCHWLHISWCWVCRLCT
jgi:hypothetical protein